MFTRPLLVIIGLLTPNLVFAQEPPNACKDFEQIAANWDEDWNTGDAPAIAALLAEDVDFVSRSGFHVKGRAEFQKVLGRLFDGRYKGSERTTHSTECILIDEQAGLLRANWTIAKVQGEDGETLEPESGTMLFVLVKTGDRWSIIAAQNTNTAPLSVTQEVKR